MAKRLACPCGVEGCKRHGRRATRKGGWGADHQRRRKALLQNSPEVCWRCGAGPRPNDPWEAGHVVPVALGGGPEVRREHRSCNRRAGAQLRAELKKREIERKAMARERATYEALR